MPVLLMFYRRHLPHWQKADSALFITWRLFGSLPRQIIASSFREKSLGKRFLFLDRELDKARYGPTWLKNPRLAKIVTDSLSHGEENLGLYRLNAYVVMSNHVHILIWPKRLLYRITKSIKGYTARECNKLLARTGESFWQDESFDHSVRDEGEFYRIKRYIERNPVKAGLVESPEEWPWSSAARNRVGETFLSVTDQDKSRIKRNTLRKSKADRQKYSYERKSRQAGMPVLLTVRPRLSSLSS